MKVPLSLLVSMILRDAFYAKVKSVAPKIFPGASFLCPPLNLPWPRRCKGKERFRGGGVLIYFSVRGRAAEQGIIFRIPTPGQGIIFVKICSMTGSIFVIFDSEKSF